MRLFAFRGLALALCSPMGCRDVCDPPVAPFDAHGVDGLYVAYNLGCDHGCEQIQRGDLIRMVDGNAVTKPEELDRLSLADGHPHRLHLLAAHTLECRTVEIVARPNNTLLPIRDAPPLWTVSLDELHRAPDWARRRMFGHASPQVALVSIDGDDVIDGRQLYGTKRLIVYWDRGDRIELAMAATFMQVLQKAQSDLHDAGVEVMFVQTRFPTGRQTPMDDLELRAFRDAHARIEDGEPLPPLPTYRFPNLTEDHVALGLEHAFAVSENLGRSPTIVELDGRGIVRWHSEGATEPPGDEPVDAVQYTIIAAIEFALRDL